VNGNLVDLESPTSFIHLVKILIKSQEKNLLANSNPDGYFYLYFIRVCIKILTSAISISGSIMIYIAPSISLPHNLMLPRVYYTSLALTIIVSGLAYYFLIDFCNEMSKF
jgi:hypothetical protein